MSEIIPFGKYKGQEIEQVRMRDPQYLQWLTQQAWFQEKFAPVYQLVVNNFAPPSEDTPAHNALQVRFLEHQFRCAFWNESGLLDEGDRQSLRDGFARNIEQWRKAPRPMDKYYRKRAREGHDEDWTQRVVREHHDDVRWRWNIRRHGRAKHRFDIAIGTPQFEELSDVMFEVEVVFGRYREPHIAASRDYRLAIEIKPCMGDDYPAVLRQIKRQKASAPSRYDGGPSHWFVLLDEFGSNSVTLDQVRLMFAHAGIDIVLLSKVRERLIRMEA